MPNRKISRNSKQLWWLLAVLLLVISISGIIFISIIWYYANQIIYSYGVVIDAGSTSSKIYLYKWPDFPTRINGQVEEVHKCKASPGISAYVESPGEVHIGIQICLEEELFPKIPKQLRNKTFVYLGATAGMRIIAKRNENAIKMLFKGVGKYLLTTGLKLNSNLEEVKIISGIDEGINAWITANFLQGTIQSSYLSDTISSKNSRKTTYGALDLGGASTQITFVPNTPTNKTNEEDVRLYGTTYSVFSHSYLCYGKSEAEMRLLALLVKYTFLWSEILNANTNKYSDVIHPCMLKGDSMKIALQDFLQVPCVDGEYAQKQFGYIISLPDHHKYKRTILKFVGTGDFSECQSLTNQLFDTKRCSFNQCSFNNIYRPVLSDKYLAFSGFNLIHRILSRTTDLELTYDGFYSSAKKYCESQAPSLETQHDSNPVSEKFRKWRCFDFIYVLTLLKGFGFNRTNWNRITFVSKINDASLGWSLGYMINKTALIPIEKPYFNLNLTGFILILLLFLVIVAATLICIIFFRRKQSRNCNNDLCRNNDKDIESSSHLCNQSSNVTKTQYTHETNENKV